MKSLHRSNYLFLFLGLMTMGLLMGISLLHFEQISQKNTQLLERDWQKSEAAHSLDAQIRKTGIMLMEMLIASEALQTDAILPRMQGSETAMRQSLAALVRNPVGNNEQDLLSSINEASSRYTRSYEHARQLISQGKKDEATRLINYETLPLLDAVQEPLLSLIELQQKNLRDGRLAISEHTLTARTQLFVLGAIAVLAALLIAFMVARRRQHPLTGSTNNSDPSDRAIAPAPLGQAVDRTWRTAPPAFSPAEKRVLDNCTLERKRSVPPAAQPASHHEVIDIEARVRSASNHTAQQSATKTSPAGEELKKNTSQRKPSGGSAPSPTLASQKGDRLVTQVVDTMGLIKAHSNQIVAFINVMDGIAADTARLAQNAEAAQAGAAGHDLTVVAAEVQALAQRACTVANEIRLLTDESAEQVDAGSELVDQAGETINEIVASVRRVSGMIRQISQNPSNDVSDALNQANARLEAAGHHTTHLVGHMAATAHGMQQKAEQVAHAVSLYKLGTLGESGRPASATIIDLALMRKRAMAKHRSHLTIKD